MTRLNMEKLKPFDVEDIEKMKSAIDLVNTGKLIIDKKGTDAEEVVYAYARFICTIETLKRENDQLQKQVARMQEAIEKAKYYLTDFIIQEDCCSDFCACETEEEVLRCGIRRALAEINKVIGGDLV